MTYTMASDLAREALEPFLPHADVFGWRPDDFVVYGSGGMNITAGDLRRARTAYDAIRAGAGVKELPDVVAQHYGHLGARIVEFFDKDETAGSFLREDGDGGFVGGLYRMAREIDALRTGVTHTALETAPVEEADAKAGEPFGWVKPESAHTREPRFIYAKDRIEDWMRAVFTVPVYASPPAPTIPSEPEAKGEAGAGPVGIPVDPETGMYDLTLANILRATREEAAYGPAHRAGAGPVGEAVAYLSRPVLAGFDPNGTEIANAMLYPKGTLRPHNEVAVYARPVDEPGEVERLTRERDEARAGCWIGDEEQRIRDLSSDVEEWKAHAKTAEAALAETRERLEKPTKRVVALLQDLASERRAVPRDFKLHQKLSGACADLLAALSTQESSAALAGDGKEAGR